MAPISLNPKDKASYFHPNSLSNLNAFLFVVEPCATSNKKTLPLGPPIKLIQSSVDKPIAVTAPRNQPTPINPFKRRSPGELYSLLSTSLLELSEVTLISQEYSSSQNTVASTMEALSILCDVSARSLQPADFD